MFQLGCQELLVLELSSKEVVLSFYCNGNNVLLLPQPDFRIKA